MSRIFSNPNLPKFHPPGNLDDLTESNTNIWSRKFISMWMSDEVEAVDVGELRTPLSSFFNATLNAYDVDQKGVTIGWSAFPAGVASKLHNREPDRWEMADKSRCAQDEYLEWSVLRDDNGIITNVSLTCEGPEYWQCLGDRQPDDILPLYKELNPECASEMVRDDFFTQDAITKQYSYNPENYWNQHSTTGSIAHLAHPSNSLSAEIDIAAQATVVRKNEDGKLITDPRELIRCSRYGGPARNSDPVIGGMINSLARSQLTISVKDPVALYINSFDTSSLVLVMSATDQIRLPHGVVSWTRGPAPHGQRIEVRIPDGMTNHAGRRLTVSDIYDTNTKRYIMYGSQLVDYIRISVTGVASVLGEPVEALGCPLWGPDPGPGVGVGDGKCDKGWEDLPLEQPPAHVVPQLGDGSEWLPTPVDGHKYYSGIRG